ncbi:MAG: type I phosphomannose isomerase catalytic subunit, partial [Ilumatobacteraceae bacterium]
MRLVRGVVQHYAWGHPSAIPKLLGIEPDGRPWAELWFGTHLGGPSRILEIDESVVERTHSAVDETNGLSSPLVSVAGELPFLVKFLAADEPLSLQAHPSLTQAQAGYARENRLAVPISNSRRIYRDPFAKPELICA